MGDRVFRGIMIEDRVSRGREVMEGEKEDVTLTSILGVKVQACTAAGGKVIQYKHQPPKHPRWKVDSRKVKMQYPKEQVLK
jgi:hypothetical protein